MTSLLWLLLQKEAFRASKLIRLVDYFSRGNTLQGTARSLPEALSGIPSIMVQKTALGQSSPYIRGLTGYHNVLLVDGVRLNHSAMRPGQTNTGVQLNFMVWIV